MRASTCLAACVLLVSPLLAEAEYIEITQPADGSVWRPCAPTQVLWESDIELAEGDVLEVDWNTWSRPPWYSLGVSSNDGTQDWTGPRPCWTEHSVIPIRHEVRVSYLPDPSIVDVITFHTFQYIAEAPFALCIDFSGSASTYNEVQARIDPPLYTSFSAYVGVLILLDGEYGEDWHALRTLSLAIDFNCTEACVPPSFVNLLPGDLAVGPWDEGVTLSSTDCIGNYGDLVYVARLDLFWLGGEGDVLILDHPEYPRQVVGCGNEPYEYEVASHGGIWKDPASTPVEATSWGAIKALYRD